MSKIFCGVKGSNIKRNTLIIIKVLMMNNILWLQKYFEECCNDDWEHIYQIKIETLDNPGWSVDIDLEDTNLEDTPFKVIQIDKDDRNWILCRVENKVFKGRGGVNNLEDIITIFREWITSNDKLIEQA